MKILSTYTKISVGYLFVILSLVLSSYNLQAQCYLTGANYSSLTCNPAGDLFYVDLTYSGCCCVSSGYAAGINSHPSWIRITRTDNFSFNVEAYANTTGASRSGIVKFMIRDTIELAGNSYCSLSVSQPAPSLSVSPSSLTIDALGSSQSFTVTSNTSWTVSSDVDWIDLPFSGASNNKTVNFSCSKNTTADSRSGTITVRNSTLGITKTISVIQATPTLEVSPATLSLGTSSFSSQSFTIESNTSWEVNSNKDWIEFSPSSGIGDGSVNVRGLINNIGDRSGTIIVSGGGITRTISVTQSGGTSGFDQNYIISFSPASAVETKDDMFALGASMRASIQYYDGLGRPTQTNLYKASGDGGKDIITSITYDAYGREEKQYLPFAAEKAGAYHTSPTLATNFTGYDSADRSYAFSQTVYEESPLNRVVKQIAPGYTWREGSGHEVKIAYGTNTGSEVMDYTIDNSTNLLNTTASAYGANTLYKTTIWDENVTTQSESANRSVEYKDKLGRVVLKRSYIGTTAYSTYYVYNDKGLLCCVVPPKATADDGSISSTELSQLCYQYLYDGRDRLIEKSFREQDGNTWFMTRETGWCCPRLRYNGQTGTGCLRSMMPLTVRCLPVNMKVQLRGLPCKRQWMQKR